VSPKDCYVCGGVLQKVAVTGRFYDYRGVRCEVPADMEIPTCTICGREWMSGAMVDELSPILERQYNEVNPPLMNHKLKITISYDDKYIVERTCKIGDIAKCLRDNKVCMTLAALDEVPYILESTINLDLLGNPKDEENNPRGLYDMCKELTYKIKDAG